MAKKKAGLIRGTGTHRRTQDDYMGVLLAAVTLDDWQDVVTGTLALAKQGDAQARAWLAQYLVGKPQAAAPTPLHVVVNQWAGTDTLAAKLAKPLIDAELFPSLHGNDGWKDEVQAAIAAELAQKLPPPETAAKPESTRVSSDSGDDVQSKLAN